MPKHHITFTVVSALLDEIENMVRKKTSFDSNIWLFFQLQALNVP